MFYLQEPDTQLWENQKSMWTCLHQCWKIWMGFSTLLSEVHTQMQLMNSASDIRWQGTPAADDFLNHCGKRRNGPNDEQFLTFATMISTLFNTDTIIYRHFLPFVLDNFKVVCCRFIVCGKGLNPVSDKANLQQTTLKTFSQIYGNSKWKNNHWIKLKTFIMANGELVH